MAERIYLYHWVVDFYQHNRHYSCFFPRPSLHLSDKASNVGNKTLATGTLREKQRTSILWRRSHLVLISDFWFWKAKTSQSFSRKISVHWELLAGLSLFTNSKIQNYVRHHMPHGASTDCVSASMPSSRLVSSSKKKREGWHIHDPRARGVLSTWLLARGSTARVGAAWAPRRLLVTRPNWWSDSL